MALNSFNQFENFIKDAPLTHSIASPLSLDTQYSTPYAYQDNKFYPGTKNVGAYAGERTCWKKSANYISLGQKILNHSKLFFVMTETILNDPNSFKTIEADKTQVFHPGTVLGLTFSGRDTLRYVSTNNPGVDKFC
tara:strand:+ start:2387 stop:2794 length:408 start_codon:yes stop_codon:yes gene_type:complete